MPHAIPKIEWKNTTKTATRTASNNTLTSIASTADIEVGMIVEGVGIPAGTTVLSKTVSTVVMSQNAVSSGTGSVDFEYRIEFDFPPKENEGEELDPKERQSVSISGKVQTSIDYMEGKRTLAFSFLSQSIFDSLQVFYQTHAYIGRSFRYFEDKTSLTYIEYELADLKWKPKKITPKGSGYVWEVPMKFRRVI